MGFEENQGSEVHQQPDFMGSNSEDEANNISTTVNT
jgi:hypothetical protein